MNLTGHPLIDVGMGIAAQLAHLESIDQLKEDDLAAAVSHLELHMSDVQKFKVLAIYWTNNPFMGKNVTKLPEYQEKLHSLTGSPPCRTGSCQICGGDSVFSAVDRCWFPLGGSFLGDSVSYPNLRGKMICANCFRALIILPLGSRLCKGGVYAFHLLDPLLQVEAVKDNVRAVAAAIAGAESGNAVLKVKTRLTGRLELLEIAARSQMWGANLNGRLFRKAQNGATLFSFSNSGTGAAFSQLHLPAQALEFFGEIMRAEGNLTELFVNWTEGWGNYVKNTKPGAYDRICDDIETRSSLAPSLGAMVRARKESTFSNEEKLLLKIYEDVALQRRERFDALERIAERINQMETRYRESLIKQLANIRSKSALLELLKDAYHHREKTNFTALTKEDLRWLDDSNPSETINLLYLLCVAED